MLMTDMSPSQRQTIRDMTAPALPEDVEVLELSNGIALIRQSDGKTRLFGTDGLDDIDLSPEGQRAAEYERAAADMWRFAEIAKEALSGDAR